MRNLSITILAIFLFTGVASAQMFTVGPKVGLTSTKMNIKESANDFMAGDNQIGYHAGVFARVGILGFYVQPEVYFHSVSGSYIDPSQGANNEVNFDRTQIDVPILFGYRFAKIFRINAGPVANFAVGDIDFSNASFSGAVEDYRNAAYGYQLGAGIDLGSITLDIRYEGNFNSINSANGEDHRLSHVLFSLGYKIF